ncbi:MAG: D-alanine--D-alanine ligase [Bacteroidota bacterium]
MKTTMALLFGGKSPEHEISLRSARNIFAAIPRDKYEIVLIGIDPNGRWFALEHSDLETDDLDIAAMGRPLCLVPGLAERQIRLLDSAETFPQIEVVFPITHGPYGEDGSLQGLLRHLNLPFVGPGVLGSAAAMDKDVTKRLLSQADLLVAEGFCFHYYEKDAIDYFAVINQLGLPVFIKPANMGSSVGVSKANNKAEFDAAIAEAFRFDHKVIVEQALIGREVECAVMGNGEVGTTSVGEVVVNSAELYDFDTKYEDPNAADIVIPAQDIDNQMLAKLVLVAKNAYRAVGCEGMTRVDMFLCEDGAVYVNELNTLPGFTSISMYPKLWAEAGLDYADLIDNLLQLALERGRRDAALQSARLS